MLWSARWSNPYLEVARWNGTLNSFTILGSTRAGVGMANGDTFMATIVGGTVTAYINGVQKIQVTDPHPFSSGNPGIGFYLANSGGNPVFQGEYGFSSFRATDDFAGSGISVSPSSWTVKSARNALYTLSAVLSGEFAGAVILGDSRRDSGVTVSFGENSNHTRG